MNKEMNPTTESREEELREETEKLVKKVKRSERSVRHYQWFVLRLLLIIIILWVLLFKIVGLTHMPNDDMYPRMDAGDLVLFYRLDKDVRSQDVIVMEKETPDSEKEELFIGRVVAIAGDTVDIDENDNLLINGNAVYESNIFYKTPAYAGYTKFPVTLGSDECFVLSDYRESGTDSRYFGPVKRSEIEGTVITIVRRNKL